MPVGSREEKCPLPLGIWIRDQMNDKIRSPRLTYGSCHHRPINDVQLPSSPNAQGGPTVNEKASFFHGESLLVQNYSRLTGLVKDNRRKSLLNNPFTFLVLAAFVASF